MSYDRGLKCWLAHRGESGSIMHCGTDFEIDIGMNLVLSCRLNFNGRWYVVFKFSGVKLELKKGETYQILI